MSLAIPASTITISAPLSKTEYTRGPGIGSHVSALSQSPPRNPAELAVWAATLADAFRRQEQRIQALEQALLAAPKVTFLNLNLKDYGLPTPIPVGAMTLQGYVPIGSITTGGVTTTYYGPVYK